MEDGKETECAVCQDNLTQPCTVPCGNQHVFCLRCLKGIITHNTYRTHFPCPLCRRRICIPIGGVAAFRDNKTLGQKLRSKLPTLRPRFRRRRSSSSRREADYVAITLPMFDYNGDLELDILSTLYPQREHQPMNREELVEAILEEIHQELWPNRSIRQNAAWLLRQSEELVASDSDTEDEPVENTNQPAAAEGLLGATQADRLTSEDILGSMDPEELDMTVVLQIIADMEENERLSELPTLAQRPASHSTPVSYSRGVTPMPDTSTNIPHRSDSCRPIPSRTSHLRSDESSTGATVSATPRREATPEAPTSFRQTESSLSSELESTLKEKSPKRWNSDSPRFPRPRMGSFKMAIAAGQIHQEESTRSFSSSEFQFQTPTATSTLAKENPSMLELRNPRSTEKTDSNVQPSRIRSLNRESLGGNPETFSTEIWGAEGGAEKEILETMDSRDRRSYPQMKRPSANTTRQWRSRPTDCHDKPRVMDLGESPGENMVCMLAIDARPSSPPHTSEMISEPSQAESQHVRDPRGTGVTRAQQMNEDSSPGSSMTISDSPKQRRPYDKTKPRRATTAFTSFQKKALKTRRATTSGHDLQNSTSDASSSSTADDLDDSDQWTRRIRDLQRHLLAQACRSRLMSGDVAAAGGETYALRDAYSLGDGDSLRDGHSLGNSHIPGDDHNLVDASSPTDARSSRGVGNSREAGVFRNAQNPRESHRAAATASLSLQDGHSLGNCHSLVPGGHGLGAGQKRQAVNSVEDQSLQSSIGATTATLAPPEGHDNLMLVWDSGKDSLGVVHV